MVSEPQTLHCVTVVTRDGGGTGMVSLTPIVQTHNADMRVTTFTGDRVELVVPWDGIAFVKLHSMTEPVLPPGQEPVEFK